MTNEENYLNSRMGKKNPFTVPEGYFEQLASQVMDRLPEKKPAKKPLMRVLRPWLYAAACICAAVFTAAMVFNGSNAENNTGQVRMAAAQQQENVSYYSDNYIEEEADYVMVDNQEIYAYLLAEM